MTASVFLEEALGALQATISVLLVLFFGASAVKYLKLIDQHTVDGVTRLSTNIFLPCLLFTEMGKESSWNQLKQFWILPVYTVAFTILSLTYAKIGEKFFKMPNWIAPAASFPNMLSLPLLLIESLAKTGAVEKLLRGPDDSIQQALSRGKVYFLVNGLAGNIIRFALGPYLLRHHAHDGDDKADEEESQPLLGGVQPGEPIPDLDTTPQTPEERRKERLKAVAHKVKEFFNPPLIAGLLAIVFGLITPVRHQVFEEGGAVNASLTQSLVSLGKLYTALQMFVLGGKLVSKKAGRPRWGALLYLFVWRFAIVPVISIAVVYGLRHRFPTYITRDPMLDFVLAISHVGPPAITLVAIADMSGQDETEQGVIATVLLASYIVTPIMALSVSGIMNIIDRLY